MNPPRLRTIAALTATALWLTFAGRRRMRLRRGRTSWDPPVAPTLSQPLSARVLGHGPPVVLLHGLGASGRYWGAAYDRLGDDHLLVVPDLLGFGASPRPDHGYGPDEHAAAVCGCLDLAGVTEPAVLVAHSAGTIVALRTASTRPDRVRAVISIGPPLYPNAQEAARRVAGMGMMARLFANNGRVAEQVCRWVCQHRELAARLAVVATPDLPPEIAADGVQHTWHSYSETLMGLVFAGDLSAWFDEIDQPVVFVAGDRDAVCDREWLRMLTDRHDNVRLETWPGDHHLPLTNPDAIIELVRRSL
jgi:pimeloyl-ACP methyl ester carboxylesterase